MAIDRQSRERLEFLRRRVDVLAFCSQFTRWRRSGRQYRALCPIHSERNPSFYVHADRRVWYCHGCQRGGDVFTLAMLILGCNFQEAVRPVASVAASRPSSIDASGPLCIGAGGAGGRRPPQGPARREELIALRRRLALRSIEVMVVREAELPPCMRADL
jgi:hypothetical protein